MTLMPIRRARARAAVVVLAVVALVGGGCSGGPDPAQPAVERAVTYAPGLALDVYRPVRGKAPLPVVVLVHGGGFVSGGRADMQPLAEAMAERGYVAVSIDYRLTTGSWFPAERLDDPALAVAAADARTDAQAAVAWVRANAADLRVDAEHVAIVGWSAGGITAIEVASHATPGVSAAVSISGAGVDLAALAQPHPPLLLLHGDADTVIPASLADGTCAVAAASGTCAVQHFEGVGHDLPSSHQTEVVVALDQFAAASRAG
jgi:acetyl esterase/lipase